MTTVATAQVAPSSISPEGLKIELKDKIGTVTTTGTTTPTITTTSGCVGDSECDDGNFCNGKETCQSGACVKGDAPSPTGKGCVAGEGACQQTGTYLCDEATDKISCNATPAKDGTSCSDGNACNGAELCQSGVCQKGSALKCDDGNVCTDDFCDVKEGCKTSFNAYKESCYDGAVTTRNVGICKEGSKVCSGGKMGSCEGQMLPASQETCGNKVDDNCDGSIDEGCCGNGVIDPGEACDGADGVGAHQSCSSLCELVQLDYCGDGIKNANEECDDGNDISTDTCIQCKKAFCGDGILKAGAFADGLAVAGETCDNGAANNDETPGACKTDCAGFVPQPVCGDGQVNQTSEACDDGNQNNADACRNNCTLPVCGDGIVDASEVCDNGAANNDDTPGACSNDCAGFVPKCGDGITHLSNNEQCDDGNDNNLDTCRNDCVLPRCGDGIVDAEELCDNGAANNEEIPGSCSNDCIGYVPQPNCGDGIVNQANEQCDDGNQNNLDACRNNCTSPRCGDGILDPATENCDGALGVGEHQRCSETCSLISLTYCGDGAIQNPNNDGVAESCDDGNQNNSDVCRNNCTAPRCGDGIVDTEELCDNGAANSDDVPGACSNDCIGYVPQPNCGDGIVNQANEQCDDGNQNNLDVCRNNCTAPRCGDGILDPATENCDGAIGVGEHQRCSETCGLSNLTYCGDGRVNNPNDEGVAETCDGQAGVGAHQQCAADCQLKQLSFCGDGVRQATNEENVTEECDGQDGIGAHQTCTASCELVQLPFCGDGILDPATENCDGALGVGEHQRCSETCSLISLTYCGDGLVQRPNDSGMHEECDGQEGLRAHTICSEGCTRIPQNFCGDGILNRGESCDNGAANNDERPGACKTNCSGLVPQPLCDENSCSDGNLCNGLETCVPDRGCVSSAVPLPPAINACQAIDRCDPARGWVVINAPEIGEACQVLVNATCVVEGTRQCENNERLICQPREDQLIDVQPQDGIPDRCAKKGKKPAELPTAQCQSDIFDCEKTCSISSPYKKVTAATLMFPNEFEKQILVFSGATDEVRGLAYQSSVKMSPQCDFSFDTCPMDGEPFSLLQAASLENDAKLNDLIGVRDFQYMVLPNFDAQMAGREGECHLEALPLSDQLFEERVWEQDGLAKIARVDKIFDLKIIGKAGDGSFILGAVEATEVEGDKYVGVDLFTTARQHQFFPISTLELGAEVHAIEIYPSNEEDGSLNLSVMTRQAEIFNTDLFHCEISDGKLACSQNLALLDLLPLAVVDENLARERAHVEASQESEEILITHEGTIYEVNEEEGEQGEEARPKRHRKAKRGHVAHQEGDDATFNPQAERGKAIHDWYQKDAQNILVTEPANLRGYAIGFENEVPTVEPLENEILTADSKLNNIQNNETVRYLDPKLPMTLLRNNYGGVDAVAFFDIVDVATGERQGTTVTIYHNKNEAPEIKLSAKNQEEIKENIAKDVSENVGLEDLEGKKIFIQVAPKDVMEDPLTCKTTLKDAAGVDVTRLILDPKQCKWLIINLEGEASKEATIIAKSVGKESDSTLPPSSTSFPLSGTTCTVDGGDLSACSTFSISKSGSTNIVDITTPAIESQETETTAPGGIKYKIAGGGCQMNPQGGNFSWLFLLLPLFVLKMYRLHFARRSRM